MKKILLTATAMALLTGGTASAHSSLLIQGNLFAPEPVYAAPQREYIVPQREYVVERPAYIVDDGYYHGPRYYSSYRDHRRYGNYKKDPHWHEYEDHGRGPGHDHDNGWHGDHRGRD